MRAINQGNIFTIYNDFIKTYERLPTQAYFVRFSKQSGFFLEVANPIEIRESKIYGVHNDKCIKVLNSFSKFERSLGVILSGDKGIGKSLFAKLLSVKAIESGYPLIIVDSYIPGVASYIESIEQECVVMFDEFDKTFSSRQHDESSTEPQTELLSLFDGLAMGKKLFVITCNEIRGISDFLINRPGRFHYHFRFEYPTSAEITEYMKDKLSEEYWGEIPGIVSFAQKVKLNYDCLRAIAFELESGVSFKEAVSDLNIINTESQSYSVTLKYKNGLCARRTDIYLDLFSESDQSMWLGDRNENMFVKVGFDPSLAIWNNEVMANIITPENFSIEYDEDDEYRGMVDKAKESEPAYLILKRSPGKQLHYMV